MILIYMMLPFSTLKIYYIALCALMIAVKMAEMSMCKPNFKYHASTHTCMQIFSQSTNKEASERACKKYKGGPKADIPGHLVHIFDEDTDKFVRGLLRNTNVSAHIGLNTYQTDYWSNKYIFRWGDLTEPAQYFNWEGETPKPESNSFPVISEKGWRIIKRDVQISFICQVKAEIQLPSVVLTCPPLLMGQRNPEIECVISKGFSAPRSEFRLNDMQAICHTNSCEATEGYNLSTRDNGASFSMILRITTVKTRDKGLLTCEWELEGDSGKLSKGCNLTVHDPPTQPPELIASPNQERYKEGETIRITCLVSGGSPPVYETTIYCDPEIRDASKKNFSAHGSTVNMEATISRIMDGKTCNCSAKHESKLYILQSSLTLSVIAQAIITKMTFIGTDSRDESFEVDANKQLRITCSASGNPAPSIALYYTDTQQLLHTEIGYLLTYSKQTSCNDSGTYICAATNSANDSPHFLERNLRVRCKASPCSTEEKNLKFGVPLNTNSTIEMCVYSFPKPSTIILYNLSTKGTSYVPYKKYSVKFVYTNEVQCRGFINLTLYSVQLSDMGNYSFVVGSEFLPFQFSIITQGPPNCPRDIEVKEVFSNMVTIAWTPGYDGGLKQTFIVMRHDVMKEVVTLQDTEKDVMEYNVTGLSAKTSYVISIDVKNEKGRTNCMNDNVTATTNDTSSFQGNYSNISPATYIIPVVILLLLVVCGVLVVIVARRRKGKDRGIKKMLLLEEVKTRPPKLDESKEKEEEKSVHTSIYNIATLDTSEPTNKIKPIVRKPKRDSSKSKPSSVKDADSKGDDEGDTYTQVIKVKKRTEKSDEVTENIYNNQLEIVNQMGDRSKSVPYQSASVWPKNMASENNDDTVEYANTNINLNPDVPDSVTTPDPDTIPDTMPDTMPDTTPGETKTPSRTVSPEGLVYVSVEISAATKNPVVKGKKVDEPQEGVEYMSIDHLATSESKLFVEGGGNDED